MSHFITGLFHLPCFKDSFTLCVRTSFLLWLKDIPLHAYATFCLSFVSWWTCELFARFGHWEECCGEHLCACKRFWLVFNQISIGLFLWKDYCISCHVSRAFSKWAMSISTCLFICIFVSKLFSFNLKSTWKFILVEDLEKGYIIFPSRITRSSWIIYLITFMPSLIWNTMFTSKYKIYNRKNISRFCFIPLIFFLIYVFLLWYFIVILVALAL